MSTYENPGLLPQVGKLLTDLERGRLPPFPGGPAPRVEPLPAPRPALQLKQLAVRVPKKFIPARTEKNPSPLPQNVPDANDIAGLRDVLDISRDELATRLGVTPRTVALWESGAAAPRGHARVLLGLIRAAMLAG